MPETNPTLAEIMKLLEDNFKAYEHEKIFRQYGIPDGDLNKLAKTNFKWMADEMLEDLRGRVAGKKAWAEHDPQPTDKPYTTPPAKQYTHSYTLTPPQAPSKDQIHSPQGTAIPNIKEQQSQSDRNVNNMTVDYEKMQKDIDNRGKFWKVPEGDTVIVPKSELGEPFEDKFKDKVVTKSNITVDAAGIEKTWSLTVGGKDSVYAKLVAIGMKHKTLIGIPIRVTRQGKDKDNTVYVIVDMSK